MSISLSPVKGISIEGVAKPFNMPLKARLRGALASLQGRYHGLDVSVVMEHTDGSKEEKLRKVLFPYESIQIDLFDHKELGDGKGNARG